MRLPANIDSDGILHVPFHREDCERWREKRKGTRIEVELRDEAAIRSNRQNRFLHGPVLDEFARVWKADGWRHVNEEREHELPRWMVRARVLAAFCPHDWVTLPDGGRMMVRRSSADLSRAEFSAMLEEMAEYLVHKDGERGLLPSPEEWSE